MVSSGLKEAHIKSEHRKLMFTRKAIPGTVGTLQVSASNVRRLHVVKLPVDILFDCTCGSVGSPDPDVAVPTPHPPFSFCLACLDTIMLL